MKIKLILIIYFISAFLLNYPSSIYSQDMKPIKLLAPQLKGGMSLMQALKERKSTREFSSKELPLQIISNLLWAANGINRPDSDKRTSPRTHNKQVTDIYLAKADGLYLFDAQQNLLIPVVREDIRALTGTQAFVKNAPIDLIYVADASKIDRDSIQRYSDYMSLDALSLGCNENAYTYYANAFCIGSMSQNVYLYCASAGLATVVRGMIDRKVLGKAMKLRPGQIIGLAQSVGYFKD